MSDGAKSRSRGAKACARICAASSWREAKPAVKSGWTSALRASDIIVFAPAEHDRAVLDERARDLDHRLLRLEHLGEPHRAARFHPVADNSEERRVGKAIGSTWRHRCSPYTKKKKQNL